MKHGVGVSTAEAEVLKESFDASERVNGNVAINEHDNKKMWRCTKLNANIYLLYFLMITVLS